ncbi:unnamed protein product, partial [marine sediment metagenome]
MKLLPALRRLWTSLPPQTWTEIYAAIITLLLLFLAAAWLLDALKGALP